MSVSWERVPTGWSTLALSRARGKVTRRTPVRDRPFNLAKGELISYANVSLDCGRQRAWRHGTLLVHWVCRGDVGGDFSLGHTVGEYHRLSHHRLFRHPDRAGQSRLWTARTRSTNSSPPSSR